MVRAQVMKHRQLLTCDSIVFSYWRRSLDVVGALLTDKQVPYLRVDGNTPSAKRREVLDMFQKQGDVSVLLMTLGTGAVGYDASFVA
jgi:SWI/SNF-related matrix-associated actin-dependent regulator of chromatin subfamily A3